MSHSAIATGLRCRCPACGEGPLFDGFLQVRRVCPSCGADLSGQDSGDGPVAFIVLIVGAVVVGLAPSGDHLEVTRAPESGDLPEGGDHDVIDAEIVEE